MVSSSSCTFAFVTTLPNSRLGVRVNDHKAFREAVNELTDEVQVVLCVVIGNDAMAIAGLGLDRISRANTTFNMILGIAIPLFTNMEPNTGDGNSQGNNDQGNVKFGIVPKLYAFSGNPKEGN